MRMLLERLENEILLCDGAMGTMLIEKGMPGGACPDIWGIENRKILLAIHKAYIDAGSDIITANTFGANDLKLKRYNLHKKAGDINKKAVEVAKEAAGGKAYVLGDIGPTGGYIKPAGDIGPEDMLHAFSEQVKSLAESGVDGIIIETMSDMEELKIAIMAAKENTKLPIIASMTFQKTAQAGFRTTSGISIPQFVNESLMAGCNIIGSNCTLSIKDMGEVITQMRSLCSSFIIAQPNAGLPKISGTKTVYDEPPPIFAKDIPLLIKAGANIIGGCCGTTPEHIKAIRKIINSVC